MSDVSLNVHGFALEQGGYVTWAQLRRAGVSARTIVRWAGGGRLIRVHRGVYAVGHLQRNPREAAHAALLAGGGRSALAGAAAMVLWGLWTRWPPVLEIVVAGDRRPNGLIVRRSATLLRRDVRCVDGLRVTSPARTLLDMAPRLSERQLTRAVNDLRLRRVLSIDALRDVIARNPTHRAVTLLRPLVETAQREPTRSELEDAFMKLLRRHGLPRPLVNVHVCGYRVDAYFPDHGLIVELDGWASHQTKTAFARDRRQDADILAATGIPTVRLPYEDTTSKRRAEQTASRLRMLLDARCRSGEGSGGAALT